MLEPLSDDGGDADLGVGNFEIHTPISTGIPASINVDQHHEEDGDEANLREEGEELDGQLTPGTPDGPLVQPPRPPPSVDRNRPPVSAARGQSEEDIIPSALSPPALAPGEDLDATFAQLLSMGFEADMCELAISGCLATRARLGEGAPSIGLTEAAVAYIVARMGETSARDIADQPPSVTEAPIAPPVDHGPPARTRIETAEALITYYQTRCALRNQKIVESIAVQIRKAVVSGLPLSELDLFDGEKKVDAISALKDALNHNKTLRTLSLSRTHLTTEGAIALAESLPLTDTLRQLELSHNPLDVAGTMALAVSMKMNHSIVTLDIAPVLKKGLQQGIDDNPDLASFLNDIAMYTQRNSEIAYSSPTKGREEQSLESLGDDTATRIDARKLSKDIETAVETARVLEEILGAGGSAEEVIQMKEIDAFLDDEADK
ncbi:hypothetical protein HKX48_005529 [Thoreauomyces humboldtii]|nr:hypothetical protein HKX48_005529 [Thoreauomyces humboldtii]